MEIIAVFVIVVLAYIYIKSFFDSYKPPLSSKYGGVESAPEQSPALAKSPLIYLLLVSGRISIIVSLLVSIVLLIAELFLIAFAMAASGAILGLMLLAQSATLEQLYELRRSSSSQ